MRNKSITQSSFYQDYPPQLERLQAEHWDPLLVWARDNFDVEIIKFDSILNNSQPDAAKAKLRTVLAAFDHWEMAGEKLFTTLHVHWFQPLCKRWSVRHIQQNHL
jgi:chaperone required for assembly of F1-ATPase